MAEGTDLLAAATNVLRFFRNESCGKCVPCRVGSTKAHDLLTDTLRAGGELDEGRRARLLRAGGDHAQDLDLRSGPGGAGPGGQRAGTAARRRRGAPAAAADTGSVRFGVTGREFFTARSVSQALAGFRPSRRTAHRDGSAAKRPCGRVPASPVRVGVRRCPASPGRPWTATRCAPPTPTAPRDGLPAYLDLAGAVRMGAAADIAVRSGTAVAIPTGAAIPDRCRRGGHGRVHPGDHARHDRGDPAGRAGRRGGASRRGRRGRR